MQSSVEFAIALLGLWVGTELAVRGAGDLGRRYGLSETFLGLSIFAIGTNAPELTVAIAGGAQQLGGLEASGLIVGNALGSVMAQGALVLGFVALMGPLRMSDKRIVRDGVTLLLSTALLALLVRDGVVNRTDGAVLLLVYAVYYTTLIQSERLLFRKSQADVSLVQFARDVTLIGGGMAIVVASAAAVIARGVEISELYGFDQSAVGVFAIGFGTSLPELALAVGAVLRHRPGLAIGNLVGSNIFDVLVAVGAGALVSPLTVDWESKWIDLPSVAAISVAGLWILRDAQRNHKRDGALMLGLYAIYAAIRILVDRSP